MTLNTSIDITNVITTTISSVEPHTSVLTSYGTLSTSLGTSVSQTVGTVLGTGLQGDQGIPGASAYDVWVAEGNIGTEQDFLDSLVSTVPGPQGVQGPVGPQGVQGIQGIQGVKGDTGDVGPQGPQGNTGATGTDGESAYAVAVANGFVGTEAAWLASLVGPTGPTGPTGNTGPQGAQGIQGPMGNTGPKGDTGDQGITGPAGLSAYQVATNSGFVGTESQWLASLIGPQGATGPKGDTGQQGIQGPAGQDGHSPVVTLVGDQISVDGVVQGPHLTGPAGSDSPLTEAPVDGKQYARKDGGWVEIVGGSGGAMATFDATLNFGSNKSIATASISDTTMTTTKVIQCFYTDKLDEVAILNMRVNERSRTAGVGFEVIGVAPDGAFGTYPVRCIVSGS